MARKREEKTETPQGGPRYPGVNPRPKPDSKPEQPKPADKPKKG